MIDLTDPEIYVHGIPHAEFAELRRNAPVAWIPQPRGSAGFDDEGYWAVTRHADVMAVSRDSETFSSWENTAIVRFQADISGARSGERRGQRGRIGVVAVPDLDTEVREALRLRDVAGDDHEAVGSVPLEQQVGGGAVEGARGAGEHDHASPLSIGSSKLLSTLTQW